MLDIILFAAFAIFMGVKLFNALGRKDYENPVTLNSSPTTLDKETPILDDVKYEYVTENFEELEKKYGPKLTSQLKEINSIDPSFTEQNFLQGSQIAFEMILTAFNAGDKKTLKELLSTEVYKNFETEIDNRKHLATTEENTLIAILSSEIKSILLEKDFAKIVVEIVSEQINLLKNNSGEVIEGDPAHVNKVSEIWTFARNLNSDNPNWKLVETGNLG
jgi:predicted lipid-binding transport protein (Tim44 family)